MKWLIAKSHISKTSFHDNTDGTEYNPPIHWREEDKTKLCNSKLMIGIWCVPPVELVSSLILILTGRNGTQWLLAFGNEHANQNVYVCLEYNRTILFLPFCSFLSFTAMLLSKLSLTSFRCNHVVFVFMCARCQKKIYVRTRSDVQLKYFSRDTNSKLMNGSFGWNKNLKLIKFNINLYIFK